MQDLGGTRENLCCFVVSPMNVPSSFLWPLHLTPTIKLEYGENFSRSEEVSTYWENTGFLRIGSRPARVSSTNPKVIDAVAV